jgi:hypothetical protein
VNNGKIIWTVSTLNPWVGCSHVTPESNPTNTTQNPAVAKQQDRRCDPNGESATAHTTEGAEPMAPSACIG